MNKTADHLRRDIIESGPYASLAQAVAIEQTERERHGLQTYQPRLDGPIWPNPLSLYWATSPYHQHRPTPGEEPMTDKKLDTDDFDRTTQATPAEDPNGGLYTAWSSEAPAEFDQEQHNIDRWAEADHDLRNRVLETALTISDAEDLIDTAKRVAREHERRASRALSLANTVAERLGRTADDMRKGQTVPAQPLGVGAKLLQHPEGAREATPTRAMPTQPRPASSPTSLPSAL